jgi:hypothetical protein
MDSNFLEQFERVSGLMLAAGPSGFLGFWERGDVIVVFVSNAVFIQSAYL